MSAPSLITNCKIEVHHEIALAIFNHEKTSTPERQLSVSWEQLSRLLSMPTIRSAKSGKGFVPAKLLGNRANTNVEYVSLAVMDSDQGVPFDEGLKRLEGYDAVLYTTHSHTEAHPKWRAVIRLEQPVKLEDFPAFRAGLVEKFGEDINDSQCNDAARFYYFPSCPQEKAHLRRAEVIQGRQS